MASGIHIKTRRILENRLKSLKLTFPQSGVLISLLRNDAVSQKYLAESLDTDSTTIMVICDALEKKGVIKRMKDPRDRRTNLICLTPLGKRIGADSTGLSMEYAERLAASCSQRELESILPVLRKLYEEIKRIEKQ